MLSYLPCEKLSTGTVQAGMYLTWTDQSESFETGLQAGI